MPKRRTENNPSAKERAKKESGLHRSGTASASSGKARILGSRGRPSIIAQLQTLLRNKSSASVGSLSERREKAGSSSPPPPPAPCAPRPTWSPSLAATGRPPARPLLSQRLRAPRSDPPGVFGKRWDLGFSGTRPLSVSDCVRPVGLSLSDHLCIVGTKSCTLVQGLIQFLSA